MRLTVLACLFLASAGVSSAQGKATAMVVPEPRWRDPQIVAEKSLPPKFEIVLTTEMPTPGWVSAVDRVDADPEARRIVARVTLTEPGGMHAQVITDLKVRVPLGMVDPGPWFFELWTRRAPDAPYAPAFATVLDAAAGR